MTSAWDDLKAEAEFRLYARASGQVLCASGHEDWWLGACRSHRCPWCKAVV